MRTQTAVERRGFTLIELLIVVVIIGILAAIAIPKFTDTKGKAYAGSMKSDLKNLASRQEDFFYSNDTYAGSLAAVAFDGSPGVVLVIVSATATGWSASATHPSATPLTCSVFYGSAPAVVPATAPGVVECA